MTLASCTPQEPAASPPQQRPVIDQFTDDPAGAADPDWSADGEWIAFSSVRSGHKDIWIRSTRGGRPIQVTDNVADNRVPRWSPDDKKLLFVAESDGRKSLWTVSPFSDSPELTRVTPDGDSVAGTIADWSPDGSEIVFAEATGDGWQLRMIAAAGGVARTVATPTKYSWDPSWSPDGMWIA